MLKRLIKYDMKSIAKVAVPMFVISAFVSLVCCAVLYYTFSFAEEINSLFNAIMMTGGLYLIGVLTIIAMFVIVGITVISRYYKSIFTDEGYLYMVIPVTKRSFLNSKIISSAIWFALSAGVAWVCIFISLLLPTLLYETTLVIEAFNLIKEGLGIDQSNIALVITAALVSLLDSAVGLVKDVTVLICAITIGATMFKRFKIVASIIVYLIIGFAEELFYDVVTFSVGNIVTANAILTLIINSAFDIVIMLVVATIMYFITLGILDKKINLE